MNREQILYIITSAGYDGIDFENDYKSLIPDLREFISLFPRIISEEIGSFRWHRTITNIHNLNGRYFGITENEGLTENCEIDSETELYEYKIWEELVPKINYQKIKI